MSENKWRGVALRYMELVRTILDLNQLLLHMLAQHEDVDEYEKMMGDLIGRYENTGF